MQELVRRKWWQEWNSEVHVKDSSAQLKISMDKSVYSLKAIVEGIISHPKID
jgi:hypothetical protein